MRHRRARAIAAFALVLGLSACGASTQAGHPAGAQLLAEGRSVFSAACSGCHTLTGHDTRVPGGDLALGHLTAAQVAAFARIMPVQQPLSRSRLLAVAAYVAQSERAIH